MTVAGVTKGIGLEQTWPEETCCDEDGGREEHEVKFGPISITEVELIAVRLKEHLNAAVDSRSTLDDSALLKLAEVILDYRERRLAEGTWPAST